MLFNSDLLYLPKLILVTRNFAPRGNGKTIRGISHSETAAGEHISPQKAGLTRV